MSHEPKNYVEKYVPVKNQSESLLLRYIFLCFSLLIPVKISTLGSFKKFHAYDSQIVCMVPPPGASSSRVTEDTHLAEEGCETNSVTVHEKDGVTTETISIKCTKKTEVDKDGNITKETDTSKPRFATAKDDFFSKKGQSSGQGSSSKRR